MHRFDAPSGLTFFCNGDFSGDVHVTLSTRTANVSRVDLTLHEVDVAIPYADLEAIVLERMRRDLSAELEQMPYSRLYDFFRKRGGDFA